jgi:hypothetical protein
MNPKTKKKGLNQKDIERLNRKIAEHLGVPTDGGLEDRRSSDEKTQTFVRLMESCGGEFVHMVPHGLNSLRRKLHKHAFVFIGNPAYHNGNPSNRPHRNDFVYMVPQEKAEILLLLGLPKTTAQA